MNGGGHEHGAVGMSAKQADREARLPGRCYPGWGVFVLGAAG